MRLTWAQRDAIRVYRIILAVKLGFGVAGLLTQIGPRTTLEAWYWPSVIARLLLAILAYLPISERVLGQSLLGIVLGLDIFLEGIGSALSSTALADLFSGSVDLGLLWTELVQQVPAQSYLLFLPVTLLAWGYGRRGALWGSTGAALVLVAGMVIAAQNQLFTATYAVNVSMLIAMLYVVPYIVSVLAERERLQHAELEAAYDSLRRHAATVEQLAVSRERNRLARELHDTLAHSLSAIAVQLEALRTLLAHDPALAASAVAELTGLARRGLADARRAIAELRTDPVQTMGLAGALRELLSALEARTGLATEMTVDGHPPDLTMDEAVALYRIAEEALLNVERHAAAERVTLSLEHNERHLRLAVADDGRGFDLDRVPPNRYGLTGMRERAAIIGAQLEVESAPGRGTRVQCTLTR